MQNMIYILLLYVTLCNCQDDDLPFFPIASTQYALYMNKKGSLVSKKINSQSHTFEASKFWKDIGKKMTTGDSFTVDGTTMKVGPSPVLPNHPQFCVRKPDENQEMIIEFDWSKDVASPSAEYDVILFNFKGDFIQRTTIFRKDNAKQRHNTHISPPTTGQAYTDAKDLNSHDLFILVIRSNNKDNSLPNSPWTYHCVFPEDFNTAYQISSESTWNIEEIVRQQSGFMMMSLYHGESDWENAAAPFVFFNFFSQVAAMEDSKLQNKYFSTISIPKSAAKEGKKAYTLKEVGQRSGAGMGINIWSTNGHYFSSKYYDHFGGDKALFNAFVKECFSYNQILDGFTQHGQESSPDTKYRNKEGYNIWSYAFESSTLTGTRTMQDDQVVDIAWKFTSSSTSSSDNWKTLKDGSLEA